MLKIITEGIESREEKYYKIRISNLGKNYEDMPLYKVKFNIMDNHYRLIFVDCGEKIIYLFFYTKAKKDNIDQSDIKRILGDINDNLNFMDFWGFLNKNL